jgi:hypothetical protein
VVGDPVSVPTCAVQDSVTPTPDALWSLAAEVKARVVANLEGGLPLAYAVANAVPLDGHLCLTNWGAAPVVADYPVCDAGKLTVVEGWPLVRVTVPVLCAVSTAGRLALTVLAPPFGLPQDTVTRLGDSILTHIQSVLQ